MLALAIALAAAEPRLFAPLVHPAAQPGRGAELPRAAAPARPRATARAEASAVEPAPDGHRRAAVAGFLAMVLLALRTPAAAADEPIVQGAAPAPAQAAAGQSGGADPSVVRPFDDRRTAGSRGERPRS